MLNIIKTITISFLVIGKDVVKPVNKDATPIAISNEDLHLLNEERIKNGLNSISEGTLVDDIIQDELDKQLEDTLNKFKHNKKFIVQPMPLMEKWGNTIKGREPQKKQMIMLRSVARGGTFVNTMEAIMLDHPERKNEVVKFYQKHCKFFCRKLFGAK